MVELSVIDRSTKAMSRLIATIISGLSRPHFPLIVLESSLVQSCLPVLRAFVNDRDATSHVLIFCLLYPPSAFADGTYTREGLHVIDRTAQVPGYSETSSDLAESILNSVKQGAAFIVHTTNERTTPKLVYLYSSRWAIDCHR